MEEDSKLEKKLYKAEPLCPKSVDVAKSFWQLPIFYPAGFLLVGPWRSHFIAGRVLQSDQDMLVPDNEMKRSSMAATTPFFLINHNNGEIYVRLKVTKQYPQSRA